MQKCGINETTKMTLAYTMTTKYIYIHTYLPYIYTYILIYVFQFTLFSVFRKKIWGVIGIERKILVDLWKLLVYRKIKNIVGVPTSKFSKAYGKQVSMATECPVSQNFLIWNCC